MSTIRTDPGCVLGTEPRLGVLLGLGESWSSGSIGRRVSTRPVTTADIPKAGAIDRNHFCWPNSCKNVIDATATHPVRKITSATISPEPAGLHRASHRKDPIAPTPLKIPDNRLGLVTFALAADCALDLDSLGSGRWGPASGLGVCATVSS